MRVATLQRASVGRSVRQGQVIVVLGGDETGLAVVRNAARLGLRPTVLARRDDVTTRSRLATCITLDTPPGTETLSMLCTMGSADDRPPLVATNDRWLRFVMAHRATLDERFTVLHPGNAVLETCLNKRRFAQWASANDIRTPELVEILHDVAQSDLSARSLPFPLFLRPEWSNHAPADLVPKATPVADPRALLAAVRAFDAAGARWVATRSLLGEVREQYSVAVAVHDNAWLSFVAQKLRPLPERCAVGSYVELRPHAAAESLARTVLHSLGFDFGIAEVEILGTRTGELVVIEVNPRPWSQFALTYGSGHDFLSFVLGLPQTGFSVRRREGLAWMDISNDVFVCFARGNGAVRRGRLSVVEYVRSLMRVRVLSTFALNDPYPGLRAMLEIVREGLRYCTRRAQP